MVLISPVAAPILGAFILNFTSWRGIFWVLAFIGILAIGGNIALEETINVRYCGSALQVIGRRGTVLRNPGFTSPSSFSPW
jgi:DHA1 family bicyclomycin/chloramphenicol resistance-like MFS transporter